MTIDHCRANQLRCAALIGDPSEPDQRGAALGLYDWFAEEFLIEHPEAVTDR